MSGLNRNRFQDLKSNRFGSEKNSQQQHVNVKPSQSDLAAARVQQMARDKQQQQALQRSQLTHSTTRPSVKLSNESEDAAPHRLLPVAEARAAIVRMLTNQSACIIVGETGSGKTTQIPQFAWDDVVSKGLCGGDDANVGIVGCTQPRRVAAVSIAKHVAEQRGVALGGEVGYAVRFDDKTSHKTRIKFMTDGILLREIQADPLLQKYSCIILDEAHERTLHGDVLFGLLKDLTRKRQKDLKIVVMSATLNAQHFSSFWRDAPIGVVHGRSYPVTVYHTAEPQADFVEAAISTILQVHCSEPLKENGGGDILCFLTGQEEIEDAKRVLEHRLKELPNDTPDFQVLTLYSAMPYEQQLRVFEASPVGVRKVILATNIAETSITVEGIKYVVDSGVVKAKSFSAKTGMESLAETDVSRAQATQRAGRAGRMSAGKCYRLYTQDAYERMAENTTPEITRSSLNSVILQMKGIGIQDVETFEFMDKPPTAAIRRAEETLFLLGALDRDRSITALGKALTHFPIEPTAAKSILCGKVYGIPREVVGVIAMIATENIYVTSREGKEKADNCRRTFAKPVGDHISYLALFQHYMRLPRDGTHRKDFCDSNSLSHRQMLKMEDTFKQLMAILDTVEVDADWFHGALEAMTLQHRGGTKSHRVDPHARGDDDGSDRKQSSVKHGGGCGGGNASAGGGDFELVRRALCHGFFMNAAYFDTKLQRYRLVIGQQPVHLHPTSALTFQTRRKPSLVIFNNVVETTQRYMKEVTAIHEQWLQDAAPLLYKRIA
ncbi:DEAD/DEAH box RNA helicase, putative [Bodo saltans]|uniref:RNA helicase n=1 Tax=Bodo saltans TaxID=75058 RepID=A0A0S4IS51_BODSA|nr:DEAD/DEAH box RNA helicase, putative [Bodo saltans]|eukprot:CUG05081.1 DEAD/DEAH box RNA helicase, putative [Bodo saltans]